MICSLIAAPFLLVDEVRSWGFDDVNALIWDAVRSWPLTDKLGRRVLSVRVIYYIVRDELAMKLPHP